MFVVVALPLTLCLSIRFVVFVFSAVLFRLDSIRIRFVSIRFDSDSIRFDSFRFVSIRIRFVSFRIRIRFVSIRFVSIRFVSIRFGFDSIRIRFDLLSVRIACSVCCVFVFVAAVRLCSITFVLVLKDLFVKPCRSAAPNASFGATNSGFLRAVEFNATDLRRDDSQSRIDNTPFSLFLFLYFLNLTVMPGCGRARSCADGVVSCRVVSICLKRFNCFSRFLGKISLAFISTSPRTPNFVIDRSIRRLSPIRRVAISVSTITRVTVSLPRGKIALIRCQSKLIV